MAIGIAVTSAWLSDPSLASTMNAMPAIAAMKKAATPRADGAVSSIKPANFDVTISVFLLALSVTVFPVVAGERGCVSFPASGALCHLRSLCSLHFLDPDQVAVVVGEPLLPEFNEAIGRFRLIFAADIEHGHVGLMQIRPQDLV